MARPRKKRTLEGEPEPVIYIPSGWTRDQVEPVEVAIEDFEVMRLVDGHAHSIEEAAVKVGVARSTAGRMLERARRALALGIEQRAPVYLDALESSILTPPDPIDKSAGVVADKADVSGLAVAVNEEDVSAGISRVFGRAQAFAIVGSSGYIHYEENPGRRSKRDAAEKAVGILQAYKISRVVAGRFGPEALELLGSAGIQPLIAIGITLDQAIEFFR
jgi:predicted DNA-binding protein (UPF0251 family)/predicted Fe-Mo cluster-binding NifX family protein